MLYEIFFRSMSVFCNVNPMTIKRKQTTEDFDEEFCRLKFKRFQHHIQTKMYKAKAYWVIGVPEIYVRGMTAEEINVHIPPIIDPDLVEILAEKMEEGEGGHCPYLKERLKFIVKVVPFLYYFPGSLISVNDLQVCPGVIGENGSLTQMKGQGFIPFLVKTNVETNMWAEDIKRRTRFQHGASAVSVLFINIF